MKAGELMFISDGMESLKIDQEAIHHYGIPSLALMEQAALAVVAYIETLSVHNVLILCGPGNNGADGFAISRILYSRGYHVHIVCPCDDKNMSEDEFIQYRAAHYLGLTIRSKLDADILKEADLVVDALFGVGLSRNIEGEYKALIDMVNNHDVLVIGVDIASGVHSGSGNIMGCAMRCDTTISFTTRKFGHLWYPGHDYCGKVIIASIGIPKKIIEANCKACDIDHVIAYQHLPKRSDDSHKGTYGKVLCIGGSDEMRGAILMSVDAALHSGCGIVCAAIPSSIHALMNELPEAMSIALPQKDGFIDALAADILEKRMNHYDVVSIGNGMGRTSGTSIILNMLLKKQKDIVIDGDALYMLKDCLELLKEHEGSVIITPHYMEFSRLMHVSLHEIENDPLAYGMKFHKEYPNVTLVLKGTHTMIFDADRIYINHTGSHALAKGGSGDVLCGIIASLLAQSHNACSAAICAVYLMGRSSDILCEKKSPYALHASDVIEGLHDAFKELSQN